MKSKAGFAALVALALLLSMGAVVIDHYETRAVVLGMGRLTALMVWVLAILPIKSMIEGDDLAADWERINQGNVAVALYRGLELAVLVAAGAVLLAQV